MAEITRHDLRKAREARNLPRWKAGEELGVSQDTVNRWETGETMPTPDDVGRMEALYKAPGLWHGWMRSMYDSYRERYPETQGYDYPLAIVNIRHQMRDVADLQDKAERDGMSGRIDDPQLRQMYKKQIGELMAALTQVMEHMSAEGDGK